MDFETMRERMRVGTDSCGTAAEIIDACAKVALDALDVPSGWPSGWNAASNGATLCYPGVTYSVASVAVQPFSGGGFYASIEGPLCSTEDTALDGARRAIWAMMGRGASTIDREALAMALHDAYVADEAIVWGERCEDVRQGYRREADTAIRLCAGADAGARIADLEARIATLTATANAAVERAEEAEVRAAKAEKALRLSADAAEAATTDEEDARRDLYEARKENRRLRHALSAALRGAQHIATVADLLLGEEDADA